MRVSILTTVLADGVLGVFIWVSSRFLISFACTEFLLLVLQNLKTTMRK